MNALTFPTNFRHLKEIGLENSEPGGIRFIRRLKKQRKTLLSLTNFNAPICLSVGFGAGTAYPNSLGYFKAEHEKNRELHVWRAGFFAECPFPALHNAGSIRKVSRETILEAPPKWYKFLREFGLIAPTGQASSLPNFWRGLN